MKRGSDMKLLTTRPWKRITAAVKRSPSKCRVAVAYFGRSASQLLPLRKGSVLVLDFSLDAVKAGHACPAEVLKLLKRGVEIHSVTNLHAKVFAVGNEVFVGSTNASQSSAATLVEAVAHGRNPGLVRQVRGFVDSLCGEPVTSDYAKAMVKFYSPPRFSPDRGRVVRKTRSAPKHSRTWLVQLARVEWTKEDRDAEHKGRSAAKRRISSTKQFELDTFGWVGGSFARRVKVGELVVQLLTEKSGAIMMSPPQRVLRVENFRTRRGFPGSIVFVEKPKAVRRRRLEQICKLTGCPRRLLKRKTVLTIIRNHDLLHRILNVWSR